MTKKSEALSALSSQSSSEAASEQSPPSSPVPEHIIFNASPEDSASSADSHEENPEALAQESPEAQLQHIAEQTAALSLTVQDDAAQIVQPVEAEPDSAQSDINLVSLPNEASKTLSNTPKKPLNEQEARGTTLEQDLLSGNVIFPQFCPGIDPAQVIHIVSKRPITAPAIHALFIQAVCQGQVAKVNEFLHTPVDPNMQGDDIAIVLAARFNYLEMAVLLLEHYACPNKPGLNEETALLWAARNQNMAMIKLLVIFGAKVNNWPEWEAKVAINPTLGAQPLTGEQIQKTKAFIEITQEQVKSAWQQKQSKIAREHSLLDLMSRVLFGDGDLPKEATMPVESSTAPKSFKFESFSWGTNLPPHIMTGPSANITQSKPVRPLAQTAGREDVPAPVSPEPSVHSFDFLAPNQESKRPVIFHQGRTPYQPQATVPSTRRATTPYPNRHVTRSSEASKPKRGHKPKRGRGNDYHP